MLAGLWRMCNLGSWLMAVILAVAATAEGADIRAQPSKSSKQVGIESFVGQSSCLARGCHGGPDRTAVAGALGEWVSLQPSSANAATIWRKRDHHTRAYQILLTDRSRQIVRRWKGLSEQEAIDSPPHPERETRCLACHTTPTLADEALNDHPAISAYRREGVSCDACHTIPGGDSRQWLDPHGRGGLEAAYATGGLQPLETAEQRAQVCVGCHVGAPAQTEQGLPVRDMNHDLIAAGHPRFLFDYATYLERLPPHWTEKTTHDRVQSAIYGQREVTTAELVLLADRAERSLSGAVHAWPEFASFDCYACHHGLQGISWRLTGLRTARPGFASWTGWMAGGPGQLAVEEHWSPEAREQLQLVETAVEQFAVAEQVAADSRKLLQLWLPYSQTIRPVTPSWKLEEVLPIWPEEHPARWTWDQAARAYYLLATWQRQTQRQLPADEIDQQAALKEIEQELSGLYQKLRWTSHAERSPVQYAPDQLASHYNRVRARVVAWPSTSQ